MNVNTLLKISCTFQLIGSTPETTTITPIQLLSKELEIKGVSSYIKSEVWT